MENLTNSVSDSGIHSLVRKYRRGMVNSLLEYLILNYLERGDLCGYDIITMLHDRFHVLLSPGQVYPVIDYMTEYGLISKEHDGRRVMLRMSHLGQSLLRAWHVEFNSIQQQLNNIRMERPSSL